MEYVVSALSGGVGGAAIFWLIKGWISERLKQSIQYEYSQKLESYKTELNSKIEGVKHENQVTQLRTSLFFDHQRNAFAALIEKIAKINTEWMANYDPEEGLYAPVPSTTHKEFESLLYQHQLFLDEECLLALSLISDAYRRSFPYDDGSGAPPHQNDCSQIFYYIDYLQPRIASIFRSKIGITTNPQHLEQIAILSAIELVNANTIIENDIPPEIDLSSRGDINAADKVAIGLLNTQKLVLSLRQLDKYLRLNYSGIHKTHLKVKQTLNILEKSIVDINSGAR